MPAAFVAAALCSACAYHNPIEPLTRSNDSTTPFAMTVGTLAGSQAGTVSVTARVQNVNGAPVSGVVVAFSATTGAVAPTAVVTGASGTATTTFTASGDSASTVRATVNGLTAESVVSAPTASAPAPGGQTPSALLNVSASGTTGAAVTFTVSSSVTGVTWNWSFGDGATAQTSTFTTTHAYGRAGVYTPSVSSSATTTGSGTVTINDPTPPPVLAPAYAVTLAASPSSVVAGGFANLTATVTAINGAPAPTGFAWDCDADGTPDFTTTTHTQACSYSTVGTTTSKVTVTGGTVTGTASTSVTVTAPVLPALLVNIVPASFTPAVGTPTNFTATVTSTGTVPATLQWQWDDTNDGTYDVVIPSAASPNIRAITFGSAGVKTVKVTVTDTATGRTASGQVAVTVP